MAIVFVRLVLGGAGSVRSCPRADAGLLTNGGSTAVAMATALPLAPTLHRRTATVTPHASATRSTSNFYYPCTRVGVLPLIHRSVSR